MDTKNQTPPINVDFFEDLTGEITTPEQGGVEEVGQRIKLLREEKGLSLEELSNLTGFDLEFLRNIETNKVQPQLGTVIKLSKALDSAFSRLVSGVGNRLYSITRKEDSSKNVGNHHQSHRQPNGDFYHYLVVSTGPVNKRQRN